MLYYLLYTHHWVDLVLPDGWRLEVLELLLALVEDAQILVDVDALQVLLLPALVTAGPRTAAGLLGLVRPAELLFAQPAVGLVSLAVVTDEDRTGPGLVRLEAALAVVEPVAELAGRCEGAAHIVAVDAEEVVVSDPLEVQQAVRLLGVPARGRALDNGDHTGGGDASFIHSFIYLPINHLT